MLNYVFLKLKPKYIWILGCEYTGDVTDRRSCTGYMFMQQGAISWCSKRQQKLNT